MAEYYPSYIWPFHIIDLNCTGQEQSITDCLYNNRIAEYSCPDGHDASIVCRGRNAINITYCLHVVVVVVDDVYTCFIIQMLVTLKVPYVLMVMLD